jgi:hypothetical protein
LEAFFLLLLLGMLRLLRKISQDWWRVAGYAMVIFSVGQLVAARMREPLLLQTAFPENHVMHHLWPLLALTGLWSFPCPLLLGLAMLATGRRRVPQVHWHAKHVGAIGWIVGATLVVFVWYVFWIGGSLSTTIGVKQALASQLPGLVQDQHVKLQSDPHADINSQLEDLSGQIVTYPAELIKRDLIITASRLPAAEAPRPALNSAPDTAPRFVEPNLMPEDLYFYYDSTSGQHVQPPAQEPRFIPLRRNPTKLLSVVVGSSTIYPVFAPQSLQDIDLGRGRGPGLRLKEINVVDGGFIHNSPIEAAYLWGATHILLIEASPKTPDIAPRNFMESAMQALGFLFAQAQRVDTLSRGSVEIYTLRPSSQCDRMEAHHSCDSTPDPDLDVFDFGQVLVMHAVDMGRNDVVPDNPLNRPRPLFTRIPGPPLFRSISEVKGQAAAPRP